MEKMEEEDSIIRSTIPLGCFREELRISFSGADSSTLPRAHSFFFVVLSKV